jgi:hypothetical protein
VHFDNTRREGGNKNKSSRQQEAGSRQQAADGLLSKTTFEGIQRGT